jgi:hypothetical protein
LFGFEVCLFFPEVGLLQEVAFGCCPAFPACCVQKEALVFGFYYVALDAL